jgi:trans-aconitate methyltransferase
MSQSPETGGGVAEHWDAVWRTRRPDEVSWYEATVGDVDLVLQRATDTGSVIDVGGGASCLVDELLDAGLSDVAVLDASVEALDHARRRLGPRAAEVEWIVADVTVWTPTRRWTVWHDRAVLHFLHDESDIDRYMAAAADAVAPGGHLVISAFGPDGPDQCSGLEVRRWSVEELSERLAPFATPIETRRTTHVTPQGSPQSFVTVVARRSSAGQLGS